ncbi:hypothetical protein FQP81_18175 [Pseudoalteromonas distincta]|uniref:hypothetical protein n=1 Tax=Pseudoalteromonas distincta TaxID=77608 RepID=UPI00119639FC|nr:hypothetical protein [Pseudoalteromonas elyakovii]TVU70383.1 hypothetical protein FQP81_18175 [Pseudoalteromonas elyakovii]
MSDEIKNVPGTEAELEMNEQIKSANNFETSDDGLPEIDKKNEKPNKPPFKVLAFIFSIVCIVGFLIQLLINSSGLFAESEIEIDAPPLPDLSEFIDEPLVDKDFLVNDSVNISERDNEVADISLNEATPLPQQNVDFSEINNVLDSIVTSLSLVNSKLDEQSGEILNVKKTQNELGQLIAENYAVIKVSNMNISSDITHSKSKLNSITNQLNDLGLNVRQASLDFPIVVYGLNTWGEDIYLTVAQKNAPEQTNFLRVGGIVGKWRLVKITDTSALFRHFDGDSKEVAL